MQIHELNNFTGTLGSGAYLAVDDGNDTGKLSTQQLLSATEARIDNIIAGPAPSAEEIVDARLGADGVTYPSLGDAIRDQVSDLKSDLGQLINTKTLTTASTGWQVFNVILKSGKTYIVSTTADVDIRASVDGSASTYSITPNREFTASQNTSYLKVWADVVTDIVVTETNLEIEQIQNAIANIEFDDELVRKIVFSKRLPNIWERGTIDINTGVISNYQATSRISAIFTSKENLHIYFGNCSVYIANMETKQVLVNWAKGTFEIPSDVKVGITVARTASDDTSATTDELTNSIYAVNSIVNNNRYPKGLQSIARLGYNIDDSSTPPEMSTLSYQEAYIHGYTIMLTDVVWTSDLVPVALHDTTINRVARNADGSVISEPIDPTTKTYAELDEYDYGIYKGELYKGTKLATIGRIALWCKMNACELYLEIRPNVVTAQMAKRLCDALAQYGMIDYCTFIVPSASTMTEIEAYAGKQRVGIVLAQNFTDAQNKALADQIIELKESGHDAFAYYYSLPMSADMISDNVYNYLADNQLYAEFTEVRDDDYLTAFLSYPKTRIFNRVAVRPEPIHYPVLSLY